jgi:hypothetical protein
VFINMFVYVSVGLLQVKFMAVHPVGNVLFVVDIWMDGWLDMTI